MPESVEPVLVLEGLHAQLADADGEARAGVELSIRSGEVVAVLGAAGSGVGALANVLLGDPAYAVGAGRIPLGEEDVTFLAPDARAKLHETGVTPDPDVVSVLRRALRVFGGARPEMALLVHTEDHELPASGGADRVAAFAAGLFPAGDKASLVGSSAR